MKVNAAHGARDLVETDVVEALEAGARYGADAVVRHEEILLPPHEDVLALGEVFVVEVGLLRLLGERAPGGEAGPVVHVGFLGRAPGLVFGLEGVFGADDFAFEVGGQGGVVFCQAWLEIESRLGPGCGRSRVTVWD